MGPSEELEEVEHSLKEKGEDDGEGGGKTGAQVQKRRYQIMGQAFMLTFLAEWGDRSQIATIALAAAKDPIGVTIGGILGHSMCTGLAVMGGRILAAKISERTVVLAGGILFLCFAAHSIYVG